MEESYVQKFDVRGFEGFLEHKKSLGFSSEEILHDPTMEKDEMGDPLVKRTPRKRNS